jgi:succinate dehydrogenase flavin-adding protein (antitoxin of CptAB toxin-antitoxin module)
VAHQPNDRSASEHATALECLRAILTIAREQAEALSADAIDRFGELLEQRDTLLARLAAAPIPTDEPAALLERISRDILDQDHRNQATLAEQLRNVRAELPVLAAGNRANRAYGAAITDGPAYVDRAS